MAVLDAVNKQGRYSLCIWCLKDSKEAINKVNSGQKAKNKVRMMNFEVKMKEAMYAMSLEVEMHELRCA